MNSKKLIQWTILFFVILMALQYFTKKSSSAEQELANAPVALIPAKTDFTQGEEVKVDVKNNTQQILTLDSKCPLPPLTVEAWNGTAFEDKIAETKLDCSRLTATTVQPGTTAPVSFKYWNNALFGVPGRYRVEMTLPTVTAPVAATAAASSTTTATKPATTATATTAASATATATTITSPEFVISEAGTLRTFFRTAFYRPLLNLFVLIVSVMPMKDLGLATIVITLLIRLILLIPSQRALVSQRKMQDLQPRLEKIKKEHAGNQERIAQETMKLWKDNKVNPFGSCLPLLIQFPFLIAVFYVIQSGLNPDNAYMLYGGLANFDFNSMNTMFLGILDLTKANAFILPLIVGVLQYAQLKLSFAKRAAKQAQTHKAKHPLEVAKSEDTPAVTDEIAAANKSMVYVMPVMIALFTASAPAGVGLYWAISTVFAIGQQMIVNRKA